MHKIWLWTELGCSSDVRASLRLSQRIKGVIVDSKGEVEESGSRVRSGIRFMYSIRSMGEIGLRLEFSSASDVRVSTRIGLKFKVK